MNRIDPRRDLERETRIIEARTAGASFREIADRYNMAVSQVHGIWQRFQRELAAKEAAWRADLAAINAEIDEAEAQK